MVPQMRMKCGAVFPIADTGVEPWVQARSAHRENTEVENAKETRRPQVAQKSISSALTGPAQAIQDRFTR